MKSKGFFLFEALLFLSLNLLLLSGLFQLFLYENHYLQKQEHKISQWQNLMGFERLFSEWLSSFSVLACLYPIQFHEKTLLLHDQVILKKTLNRLIFYTGSLSLVTKPQDLPQQAWMINHEMIQSSAKKAEIPFWLFQYDKKVLKMNDDKIYLLQDGHAQMLLEGLEGLKIDVFADAIELSIRKPHFFKRYDLCQNINMDGFSF